MKKYLMVFLMVLLFSTAVSAQTQGYIGLFADVTHTSWCASAASVPGNFNMWIYCLPRSDGMFCAEFMIQMPADPTLILATTTPQDGYSVIMGNLTTGVSICFNSCQTDWIWTHQLTCLVIDETPSIITLDPHEDYILERLDMGVRRSRIAQDLGCCGQTLASWLKRHHAKRTA